MRGVCSSILQIESVMNVAVTFNNHSAGPLASDSWPKKEECMEKKHNIHNENKINVGIKAVIQSRFIICVTAIFLLFGQGGFPSSP